MGKGGERLLFRQMGKGKDEGVSVDFISVVCVCVDFIFYVLLMIEYL